VSLTSIQDVFLAFGDNVIDLRNVNLPSLTDIPDNSVVKNAKPLTQSTQPSSVVKGNSTNALTNQPALPRMTMTNVGSVVTGVKSAITNLFSEISSDSTLPPKPYIKGMDSSGKLTIGFTGVMQVPDNLDALNNEQVALRTTAAAPST